MTCWKCGADTPDGVVECYSCDSVRVTHNGVPVQPVAINFEKVLTLEDLKEVMAGLGLWVVKGSELHRKLRRFTDE